MQRHGTISKECLDFRYEEVTLFKKVSHLKFVTLQLATLVPAQNRERSAHSNTVEL